VPRRLSPLALVGSLLRAVFRVLVDPRVPLRLKALLPAALLYLILPIDLVPDFIPLAGRLDDLLVLALAVGLMLALAPSRRKPARKDPSRPRVIEGSYRVLDDDEGRG